MIKRGNLKISRWLVPPIWAILSLVVFFSVPPELGWLNPLGEYFLNPFNGVYDDISVKVLTKFIVGMVLVRTVFQEGYIFVVSRRERRSEKGVGLFGGRGLSHRRSCLRAPKRKPSFWSGFFLWTFLFHVGFFYLAYFNVFRVEPAFALLGLVVVFFGSFLSIFPEVYVVGLLSLFLVSLLGKAGFLEMKKAKG